MIPCKPTTNQHAAGDLQGGTGESGLVLRLWRSRYQLASGDMGGGLNGEPIWYGALYEELIYRPWRLITIATTTTSPDAYVIPNFLPAGMPLLSRTGTENGTVRRVVLGLPSAPEHCLTGMPVGSVSSAALRRQGPDRNSTSPYQARVVVPVLSVSVSSP